MKSDLCEYCKNNNIKCYSKLYTSLQLKILSNPFKKDNNSIQGYWNEQIKPELKNIPFILIKSLIRLKWFQIERYKK